MARKCQQMLQSIVLLCVLPVALAHAQEANLRRLEGGAVHATLGRPVFTRRCKASLQAFLAQRAMTAVANESSCYSIFDAILSNDLLLTACTDGGLCLRPDLVSMGGLWGRLPQDVEKEQGALTPIEEPIKDALGVDDEEGSSGTTDQPSSRAEGDSFLPRKGRNRPDRTLRGKGALIREQIIVSEGEKPFTNNSSARRQLAVKDMMPRPPVEACPLCVQPSSAASRLPCRRDIGAFLQLAQEQAQLLTNSDERVPSSDIASAAACAHPYQLASLALLRDQPEVVCNRLTGSLPFRAGAYSGSSLTQCVACAVMACLPGMMCPSNTPPRMCGPGLQCPGGLAAIQPLTLGGGKVGNGTRRLQTSPPVDPRDVEETAVRRDNLLIASTFVCPSGMACAGGGTDPYHCPWGSWCPKGSSRPIYILPIAATLAAVALVLVACRPRAVQKPQLEEAREQVKGGRSYRCLQPKYGRKASCCCRPAAQTKGSAGAIPAYAAYKDWRLLFRFSGLAVKSSTQSSARAVADSQQYRLNGVSGVLIPGRITAILGGSGAGKTTLLRTLLGHERVSSGQITVGITTRQQVEERGSSPLPYLHTYTQPQKLLQWAIGLVPQHDLLSAELTVREAVRHSAQTRLPATTPSTEVHQHVEHVLAELDLLHIADHRIGDTRSRGISGGERKRVCIAVELARDPLALMLDEPTSGLDATAAVALLEVLQRTSRARCIPVLVVIHSPRMEAWQLIDDVILLASGGCTAYAGAREGMVPCLEEVVRTPAPGFNPANWALDVLQGVWLQRRHVTAELAFQRLTALCTDPTEVASSASLVPKSSAAVDVHEPAGVHNAAGIALDTMGMPDKVDGSSVISLPVLLPASSCSPVLPAEPVPEGSVPSERHVPSQRRSVIAAQIVSSLIDCWRDRERKGHGMEAMVTEVKQLEVLPQGGQGSSRPDTTAVQDGEAVLRCVRASRAPPGWMYQAARHMSRAGRLRYRGPTVLLDICSMSVAGIIVGVACVGGPLFLPSVPMIYFDSCPFAAKSLCAWAQRWMIGPGAFYVSIVAGSMAIPPAVRIFGAETAMGRRAVALGALNVPAYFCAKLLTEAPMPLLLSACFTAFLTLLSPWRAPWYMLWAVVCSEMVAAGAVGVLLSVILPSTDSANLTGVILAGLTLNIFGGFVPVVGTGAYWAYTRYVQRAIAAAEVIEGFGLPEEQYSYFVPAQWAPPAFWLDIACLWAMAGILLLIALPILNITLSKAKL